MLRRRLLMRDPAVLTRETKARLLRAHLESFQLRGHSRVVRRWHGPWWARLAQLLRTLTLGGGKSTW
jgi:hypothetical protein